MGAITPSTALWYASRATGVVSLVLLSAVMILGMLVNRQGRLPGLPRFAGLGLHRNLSLLAVAFVVVHVLTAVADSYVSISVAAVAIPFVSSYKPLWLGLGAVCLDLMAAVIVTSLLRRHIGRRAWRVVHWLAYASWPVAVLHSIGSSSDLRAGPFLALVIACIAAVGGALAWRLITARAVRTSQPAVLPQAWPAAAAPVSPPGEQLGRAGLRTVPGDRRGLARAGDR